MAQRPHHCTATLVQGSSTPSRHQLRFYSKPHPPHLVLDFEDVDRDDGFIRVASREQVAAALTFAREQATGSLLIHCYHGVGRSAAIALAVLADRLGPGSEDEAMNQLLTIRPEATPKRSARGSAARPRG